MRIAFKILVVLGVVIGISNYVIYLQTGRMPVQEWVKNISLKPSDMASGAKNLGKNVIDQVKPSEPTKVYKWTDENGVVHYGERAATENAEEVAITDHDVVPVQAESAQEGDDNQAPLEKAKAAAEAMKARIKEQESY